MSMSSVTMAGFDHVCDISEINAHECAHNKKSKYIYLRKNSNVSVTIEMRVAA